MKIEVKDNSGLPVEIGKLNFTIPVNDENIEMLADKFQELSVSVNELKGKNIKAAREFVIQTLDVILGEGAGTKVYEQTPSTKTCLDIMIQVVEQLKEELIDIYKPSEQVELAQQYVKKKNKK